MENVIYTIAQSGTSSTEINTRNQCKDLHNLNSSKKIFAYRAKMKMITEQIALALIDVANLKGDQERVKSYWNAYNCLKIVNSNDSKIFGRYCKSRFCLTCNSIRKAKLVNKYYPVIIEWSTPYLLTLTIKGCSEGNLEYSIDEMFKAFQHIYLRLKKRSQRKKNVKLIGIKSFECNYNPKTNAYNPHFHIIIDNYNNAELIKNEWLKYFSKSNKGKNRNIYASHKAQDLTSIMKNKKSIIEAIKYGNKIFSNPKIFNKNQKNNVLLYANALDNILSSIKGRRIFDRFGFNNVPSNKSCINIDYKENVEEWHFDPKLADWVNHKSGENLLGYYYPADDSYLFKDIINKEIKY